MAAAMTTLAPNSSSTSFIPREHGATAMLLIPFFTAAILAREWRSAEIFILGAAWMVYLAKEPLIVVARQRWVWREFHPESYRAKRLIITLALLLAGCGLSLLRSWPLWALAAAGIGVVAFMTLTVVVNVKNLQRSTLFQIVSAVALSATSLATCLSAAGAIQPWCWKLWMLNSLQATAGILVVHARLEARIAARKNLRTATYRRPALIACLVLLCAAVVATFAGDRAIAAALLLACAGYFYDLHRQKDARSLQMPLKSVGVQALCLSIAYALLVIVGLW